MTRASLAAWVAFLAGSAGPASAHVTSTSYLTMEVGAGLHAEWEIAVRDIEYVLRLDRGRFPPEKAVPLEALAEYALPRLALRADGQEIRGELLDASIAMRDGVPHCLFTLGASLPSVPARMEIDYRLFVLDEDPNHRALFSVTSGTATHSGILERGASLRRLTLREPSLRTTFVDFLDQGVWHIWLGFDHVAFLIALLLPAVLVRNAGGWAAAHDGRRVLAEVLRVVTAFTVAHSVTLVLATLGVVTVSGRIVEPAIAVSVLWAAAANLGSLPWTHGWPAAFAFGLLHGFGFAGALQELALPSRHLGWALLAFNAGVELGQLAIVAVFVPAAFAVRGRGWYESHVLRYGSLGIAALAVIWLGQRLSGS
jgi:branched-subunit amino acid transport protein